MSATQVSKHKQKYNFHHMGKVTHAHFSSEQNIDPPFCVGDVIENPALPW